MQWYRFCIYIITYRLYQNEWVKFPGKIKKGGVITPDDNMTWQHQMITLAPDDTIIELAQDDSISSQMITLAPEDNIASQMIAFHPR
jgi:hypothetical protein